MQPGSGPTVKSEKHFTHLVTVATFVLAAVGVVGLAGSARFPILDGRYPFARYLSAKIPPAQASVTAFGSSGEVKMRFALPSGTVGYPLQIQGSPEDLQYGWVRLGDSSLAEAARDFAGADVMAPAKAGFYNLALVRGRAHKVLDELTLAVLVPFNKKQNGTINGYQIGTYIGERLPDYDRANELPQGFLEINPSNLSLRLSKHLRVSDFLNHDNQTTWPRYAAVSPRLLDKLELVIAEVTRWYGTDGDNAVQLSINVNSGFRTPDHNRKVRRAAKDSQHQYGDAADVVIDANGDGRFSAMDSRMIGLAVEIVEMKHPHLAGGLGLYTRRSGSYVHIDARGKKARWRG